MIFVIYGRHWKSYFTQRDVGRNTHREHKHRKYQIYWRKAIPFGMCKSGKVIPALSCIVDQDHPGNSNTPEVHQAKVTVCSDS